MKIAQIQINDQKPVKLDKPVKVKPVPTKKMKKKMGSMNKKFQIKLMQSQILHLQAQIVALAQVVQKISPNSVKFNVEVKPAPENKQQGTQ